MITHNSTGKWAGAAAALLPKGLTKSCFHKENLVTLRERLDRFWAESRTFLGNERTLLPVPEDPAGD